MYCSATLGYEDELHAILNQVLRFVKHLSVLSWDDALLRNKHNARVIRGKQAVEQVVAIYNEAAIRAKKYRNDPASLEQMEDQTWVVHLSKGLLENLPKELNLQVLTHLNIPLRMRISYLFSSSFGLREYNKLIPTENGITLGFDSYSEKRIMKEKMIAGTVTAGNQSVHCRFLSE